MSVRTVFLIRFNLLDRFLSLLYDQRWLCVFFVYIRKKKFVWIDDSAKIFVSLCINNWTSTKHVWLVFTKKLVVPFDLACFSKFDRWLWILENKPWLTQEFWWNINSRAFERGIINYFGPHTKILYKSSEKIDWAVFFSQLFCDDAAGSRKSFCNA